MSERTLPRVPSAASSFRSVSAKEQLRPTVRTRETRFLSPTVSLSAYQVWVQVSSAVLPRSPWSRTLTGRP
ncbi:hypothetical protein STANM309S_00391 [Streptomyces tanashiensis]